MLMQEVTRPTRRIPVASLRTQYWTRVIKRQFGYMKVRYRGLKKNTAQIVTLFALSNLWMARHALMQTQGARG